MELTKLTVLSGQHFKGYSLESPQCSPSGSPIDQDALTQAMHYETQLSNQTKKSYTAVEKREYVQDYFPKVPDLEERDNTSSSQRPKHLVALFEKVCTIPNNFFSVSVEQPSNENHTYYVAKSRSDGKPPQNKHSTTPKDPRCTPPALPGFIEPFSGFSSAIITPDPLKSDYIPIDKDPADYARDRFPEVKNTLERYVAKKHPNEMGKVPEDTREGMYDIVTHWFLSSVNKMAVTFEGTSGKVRQIFEKA